MPANGEVTWTVNTVDSTGKVGIGSSIAIDNFGYIWISYSDKTTFPAQLKVAHFTGSKWETSTIDIAGDGVTAIATDATGVPSIVYQDCSETPCLKIAKLVGTSWEKETVDAACTCSCGLSLVIDATGKPHISYIDTTEAFDATIKYAVPTTTGWSVDVVSHNSENEDTAPLQLDHAGNPCISYYDSISRSIIYCKKTGATWSYETVDSGSNYPSLYLNSADNPCISYFKADGLHYAYSSGGTWHKETVDSTVGLAIFCSLKLDSAGYPHISYYDRKNGDLKYAYYDGAGWNTQTIDSTNNVGEYISLALDNCGNPHISYFEETNSDLKYASSAFVSLTVTPESSGVGAVLFSAIAAIGCYLGIKKRIK